jgi:hypothetical protein
MIAKTKLHVHNSYSFTIFHMLYMLRHNLVFRNSLLNSYLPLGQSNDLVAKSSCDFF